MFTVTPEDLEPILADYGFSVPVGSVRELQRNTEEEGDGPLPRALRLILRLDLEDGCRLVLRLRNEPDLPRALAEEQCRFAALLRSRGVETPRVYAAGEDYVSPQVLHGYPLLANLEDFAPGELTLVDEAAAEDTGALLARMHGIAERENAHVSGEVLFDPLRRNDLFRPEAFAAREELLCALDRDLYRDTLRRGDLLRRQVEEMASAPRYAVQGDISDCNLYRTAAGRLGVFDFNRSGDNILFFDAVMQGLFEARLMDYPPELGPEREDRILAAFFRGYDRVRPFTREQRALYPALYALITAFWLGDLVWDPGSLRQAAEEGDRVRARQWLETVHRHVCTLPEMPL